jgi:hypothetical protein
MSPAEKIALARSGVNAAERTALICSAMDRAGSGRAAARRGEPGDHEQNSDGDDVTIQPVVIRGISSAFFGLTPLSCSFIVLNLFSLCFCAISLTQLSCSFIVLNLFSLCFVRLLFFLFYRCFGAISLTPLSCAFVILNLFSLCFTRLLFLFLYRCFGASLTLFGVIVLCQRFRIDIILCVWLPVTSRGPE